MTVVQPAGNYYDKYRTRNPISRYLMQGFLDSFDALWQKTGVAEAIEAGCGEGELSKRMASNGVRVRAFDIAEEAIAEARQRAAATTLDIDFSVASLEAMQGTRPSPLVVCCEVLEHLDDPAEGLRILETLTSQWVLVSVPREPIWRVLNLLRGKYVRELGNTPGHVNHWSRSGFIQFVESRFDIAECRNPLPWTMLLCRRR